jgi:hypothetical protein
MELAIERKSKMEQSDDRHVLTEDEAVSRIVCERALI